MYISKKILIFIFSFLFVVISTVYATNTINGLTDVVTEGDIISATYYNNLNGSKSDGGICRYSGDKLVCLDTEVNASSSSSGSTEKFIVSLTEIQKYHDGCQDGASYFYYCNSAAHRYCTDACADSGGENCAGGVSGLNFTSGFMNEIDSTQIVVTCLGGDFISNSTIPDGFTETNGIIHTISEQPAESHGGAIIQCLRKKAHICNQTEYRLAGLGTNFGTKSNFTGADSQLWWNGDAVHNYSNGENCVNRSCTQGGTVSAGYYDTNRYVMYDITACEDRCDRSLKFYCCY